MAVLVCHIEQESSCACANSALLLVCLSNSPLAVVSAGICSSENLVSAIRPYSRTCLIIMIYLLHYGSSPFFTCLSRTHCLRRFRFLGCSLHNFAAVLALGCSHRWVLRYSPRFKSTILVLLDGTLAQIFGDTATYLSSACLYIGR